MPCTGKLLWLITVISHFLFAGLTYNMRETWHVYASQKKIFMVSKNVILTGIKWSKMCGTGLTADWEQQVLCCLPSHGQSEWCGDVSCQVQCVDVNRYTCVFGDSAAGGNEYLWIVLVEVYDVWLCHVSGCWHKKNRACEVRTVHVVWPFCPRCINVFFVRTCCSQSAVSPFPHILLHFIPVNITFLLTVNISSGLQTCVTSNTHVVS